MSAAWQVPQLTSNTVLQQLLRGLQESFKRFHKTVADHASLASLLEKTRSRLANPQQAKIVWDVLSYNRDR